MMMEDSEHLREHVKILATSEGRAVGSAGHRRARKYLCATLKHLGLKPYSGESFELIDDSSDDELVNVIAVAPGRHRQEQPVLIGAHYDTFGAFPGADDNAAGNAILLELGKALVQSPAACDVVFAFFDGEELGCVTKASMVRPNFTSGNVHALFGLRCSYRLHPPPCNEKSIIYLKPASWNNASTEIALITAVTSKAHW